MADDKTKGKADEAQEEKFNSKWLKGKRFGFAVPKKMLKDGRKVRVFEPKDRPLTEDDVLSWKVRGDQVTVVTGDGQKFTVDK